MDIYSQAPKEEQNVLTLLEFLKADVGEKSEKNAVDMLFEELEKKEPDHFAVKNRNRYKYSFYAPAISYMHIIDFLCEDEKSFSSNRESVIGKLRKYQNMQVKEMCKR